MINESKEKSKEQVVKKKPDPKPYTPQYGVIVLCESESRQEAVYNFLKKEGYKCRIVTT